MKNLERSWIYCCAVGWFLLRFLACGGAVEQVTPTDVQCVPGHIVGVGLGPDYPPCCAEPDAGVAMVGACVANGGGK